MNKLKFFLALLIAVVMCPALFAQSEVTEPRINPGSHLQISFKNIPAEDATSVTGTYTVSRGDGTLNLPYLSSRVKVQGMTVRNAEAAIRSQYVAQKIYSDPIIQVTLDNGEATVDTRYITVSGYVSAKKNLQYREGISLIEALLECGDITDYGSRYIQVTRGKVTRTYDYFSARDRAIKLQPNDSINVPRRGAFEPRPDKIGP